jgi:hypothetical protein
LLSISSIDACLISSTVIPRARVQVVEEDEEGILAEDEEGMLDEVK